MEDRLTRIKFIGFSVTSYGDPPIPELLESIFKSANEKIDVSYASLDGHSIDSLPYLLSSVIKKGDVDLVVLEITTSWYSIHKASLDEACNYIKLIIDYLEHIDVRIMFLNLYRRDIDDEDLVVKSIDFIASGRYPILNFKDHYRNLFLSTGYDGTVDGIHPTVETISYLAEKIHDFILLNIKSFRSFPSNISIPNFYNLLVPNAHPDKNYLFKSRHGINLPAIKMIQGDELEMHFEVERRISGIFYLLGPDTNYVNLFLDDIKIQIPMRDEQSYYRRIGYKNFGERNVSYLKLEHPLDDLGIELAREPYEKLEGVTNYIFGFTTHI